MLKLLFSGFLFFISTQAFSYPISLNINPYPPAPHLNLHFNPYPPFPHYYPVVPYPVPSLPVCSVYEGSNCYTWTGHVCPLLAPYYQPLWLNSCVDVDDFLHLCITTANLTPPIQDLLPICAPQGSSCFCSHGLWNGYPAYEPGQVGF